MSTTIPRYLESLRHSWSSTRSDTRSWLQQLRLQAFDYVGKLQLPTRRDEEWRFTDISPLMQLAYQPASPQCDVQLCDISPWLLPEAKNRLVFVDGHFSSQLSVIDNSKHLIIGNLPVFMASHASVLESQLGRHASCEANVFTALNTAFLNDAAIIIVPKHTAVTGPIHLLFVTTQSEVTAYPRCLFLGEAGSQATLIEDYISLSQTPYITNTVTEINLHANAQIEHIRVQRDSVQAFHLASCAVSLAHASRYQSVSVSLGGQISRYNLDVGMTEEAAECKIDGLTLIGDRQLADTHTSIDHSKANGISRQQHKCIVDDAAHAVFNGKILVHPQAQRTDSSQSSHNLLLSKTAQVDTKPQLEIFADDVKCAHGATVGQLDADEIFYLQSRGLSKCAARDLLTYAFGAEVINRISVTSLKQQLEQAVLSRTQSFS